MIDGKILATQKSDEEGPLEVWGNGINLRLCLSSSIGGLA